MDLKYGSPARHGFATNVGLITSNGPHGHNIMAAEWTLQVSYDPGLIMISVGPAKATCDNIAATQCFGVTIASEDQNIVSSMAGGYSGKKTDKIGLLKELGYRFRKAEHIDVWMPEGGTMQAECTVVHQITQGDHILFFGKAVSVTVDETKNPLVYHRGQYWQIGAPVHKPSPEERDEMKAKAEKHQKP